MSGARPPGDGDVATVPTVFSLPPIGRRILELAESRIGQHYVFGARAKYDDPGYAGPWDCAELATWAVFQASGVLFGTTGSHADPAKSDAFSGSWIRDAHGRGTIVTLEQAAAVPGAVLVRAPHPGLPGHVAISDGAGGTVEAMSPKRGVSRGRIGPREWTLAVLVPGVQYAGVTP